MDYEKALVFGDTHIPFENQRALDLALGIGQEVNPDIIFLNGDILDCWEVSRFYKNLALRTTANLVQEISLAKSFLKELRWKFPKAKIVYIFGNHEHRFDRFISENAKELYGLKGMTLEEQLELVPLNIKSVNSGTAENSYLYGKLLIGHFDRCNKHSGYTAKNLLEEKSISLIQNHTHRGGSSYRRLYDRDIVAFENFCLCDRSPQYVDHPNWQLGFSVIYKDKQSDYFFVEPHPIAEITHKNHLAYKCFHQGKLYVH